MGAEAYAIEMKAKAESEQMARKADAWGEYREAALVDMMLKVLPGVAAEVSQPLSQMDKITMVSTGDGPIGASKLQERCSPLCPVYLTWFGYDWSQYQTTD